MPKVVSNRKLLKSIRNSAHPFSVQEKLQLENLPSSDLLQSIADHLTNASPAERSLGTDMVAQFLTENRLSEINNSDGPEKLDDIVRKLASLLLDRAENVRFGSIDALCYLSSLSDEMCDRLIENKLLETILKFFETFLCSIGSWASANVVKVTDKKLTSNIFVDCFNLLTNLCGTSPKSIPILLKYRDQFCAIICSGLQPAIDVSLQSDSPLDFIFFPISIAAAQFLSVITEETAIYQRFIIEDNGGEKISDDVAKFSISNSLNLILAKFSAVDDDGGSSILSNQILYLKSFLIFIACQQSPKPIEQLSKLLLSTFESSSSSVISVDEQILKFANTISNDDLSSEMRHLELMKPEYDQIKYRYLTKRNCLELLTNLTSISGDDFEEMLNDDDGDEEEMVDEDMEMMACDDSLGLDPILIKFLQDVKILEVLIAELRRLDQTFGGENGNVRTTLVEHVFGKDICSIIQSYRISALTLIHNLIASKFLSSGIQPEQQQQVLQQIWLIVGQLSIQNIRELELNMNQEEANNGVRIEIIEEAINVIRAFLCNFNELTLSMSDLQLLYSFVSRTGTGISTKVNVVRILASVASSTLANQTQSDSSNTSNVAQTELIAQISNVLLEAYHNLATSRSADSLVLKAEILDSIIDIFSDDNPITDHVMRKLVLLTKLAKCSTDYRKDMKDGANRECARQNPVIGTVRLNLNRFIDYKRKHLSQSNNK